MVLESLEWKSGHDLGAGTIEPDSLLGWFLSISPIFTCFLLFLSPFPTIQIIYREKSTKSLPALPYISMAVQSIIWATYGVLVKAFTVFTPNILGFVLGVYYSYVYQQFALDLENLQRLYFISFLVLLLFLGLLTTPDPEISIGLLGMCGTILFTFSPLVMIVKVCKTKSVASMPFHLSFIVFLNASLWTLYGWFVRDDFAIWFPNTLALFSGSAQLICHLLFAKNSSSKNLKFDRLGSEDTTDEA